MGAGIARSSANTPEAGGLAPVLACDTSCLRGSRVGTWLGRLRPSHAPTASDGPNPSPSGLDPTRSPCGPARLRLATEGSLIKAESREQAAGRVGRDGRLGSRGSLHSPDPLATALPTSPLPTPRGSHLVSHSRSTHTVAGGGGLDHPGGFKRVASLETVGVSVRAGRPSGPAPLDPSSPHPATREHAWKGGCGGEGSRVGRAGTGRRLGRRGAGRSGRSLRSPADLGLLLVPVGLQAKALLHRRALHRQVVL